MARYRFTIAVLSVAMLCSALSPQVLALGLGEIEIQSTLNDPLKAVIKLTSGTPEELKDLKISIASQEAFERAGISRPVILRDFKFTIDQTDKNRPVIRASTREPVREPFLVFLVEATWPRGRLLRQYTVLVDPPTTIPARPITPKTPLSAAPQPEVVTAAPPAPKPPLQPRPVPASVPAAPPPQTEHADTYGPVRRSETLWTIANRLRPDSGITTQQMMLALQRANPEAFMNNNINNLKAGVVLQIPSRDEILGLSPAEALREASRQYSEWQTASSGGTVPEPAVAAEPEPGTGSIASRETRLQLVAPEDEGMEDAAAPGAPESGSETEEISSELQQQLALATEEAEAGRARADELESRLGELEVQVTSMQRLLELKDEQLASLQNRLSAAGADQQPGAAETMSDAADDPAATEEADDAEPEPAAETPATDTDKPANIMEHLLENPVLSGLGVLVAMILGGILWSSTRQRKHADLFSDEPTLANQLSALKEREEPLITGAGISDEATPVRPFVPDSGPPPHEGESDPLTEADVFIAYGRVQQAEDVIQAALHKNPEDKDLKVKLLEVYHAAGNLAAFDTHAEGFHRSVDGDDPLWQKVALMGYELSPGNRLYKDAAGNTEVQESGVDFDMDLSGMDDLDQASAPDEEPVAGGAEIEYEGDDTQADEAAETVEFNLDELGGTEQESTEELLDDTDEVGTKLDLARAYLDMGDPEGARSILEEVLEEGNEEQKREAESLFTQLA